MASPVYGWCGKILKVDLSLGKIMELDTMAYADRFLGGRGVATRIYWDEVGPDVGAFDPENRLILMTGPLAATGAQAASRFEVVGKSPMTLPEGFCYGNLGGYFGPFMKKAGYDGVVVFGRAEKPCYIYVEDGKAEIRDAAGLWGTGVYETRDRLKERHGKNVRFVATGPAGENLCRAANIITDNEGSATGGWGAVMGSKHLKAIAVNGSGSPTVARPEELRELNRLIVHLSKREPPPVPFPGDQVTRVGRAPCFQCGLDCTMRSTYRTLSGKEVIRKCQSTFVYLPWVARRPGEPIETAVNATAVCNDLSLCTMEIANVIQWLTACHKAGCLTEKETGLDMSTLGTPEFFEHLTGMIARREGFGDILAEGLVRAGEQLGGQAKALFTNEIRDVGSGAGYSPREYITNGMLYALEPRQPIAALHEVSRLIGQWVANQARPGSSPVTSEVYRAAAERFWGGGKAWDLTTIEDKAQAAIKIQNRTYFKDSLPLCDSSWPLMISQTTEDHIGDPTLESRVFSVVTGIDTDEAGLQRYGDRIFNQQRAVLLREGWRPVQDDTPAEFNFTDPVQYVFMNPKVLVPGPGEEVLCLRGKTLDRSAYEEMRRQFYELRGWDAATGLQKQATLAELGLADLADELKKIGRLG